MAVVYGAVHGVWDYAGVAEVARFLGVSKQAFINWRQRGVDIPAPIAELSMGPIWRLCDIRNWARKNGKGPYAED